MSIGFYHWIWVVARVLSRKLGDGSYSELVVLLGEKIFLGLIKKNIYFLYQKSQKNPLNCLCWSPGRPLHQKHPPPPTDDKTLATWTLSLHWQPRRNKLCAVGLIWSLYVINLLTIETMEIWQKWKKREVAILSFNGRLPLWLYLTDDVDHHLHNPCQSAPGTKVVIAPSPSPPPLLFISIFFFKVSHPFPLLLPLCKWCHLLFFSVLVVDRLSIEKGWSLGCKTMKMYNMV